MSKSHPTLEADNFRSPLLLPGDWLSVYVGDLRGWLRLCGQRRVGERAYMEGVLSRQHCFAILFHIFALREGQRERMVAVTLTETVHFS